MTEPLSLADLIIKDFYENCFACGGPNVFVNRADKLIGCRDCREVFELTNKELERFDVKHS